MAASCISPCAHLVQVPITLEPPHDQGLELGVLLSSKQDLEQEAAKQAVVGQSSPGQLVHT